MQKVLIVPHHPAVADSASGSEEQPIASFRCFSRCPEIPVVELIEEVLFAVVVPMKVVSGKVRKGDAKFILVIKQDQSEAIDTLNGASLVLEGDD